jgi:hypothetical protein
MQEELVGEVKVRDLKWRVTHRAGVFRIWTDASDPRYVISSDIPCEVFELMAREAAAKLREQESRTELGPDVELQEWKTESAKASPPKLFDRAVREANDEIDFP